MAEVYDTGVRYQFYHALGLMAVAVAVVQWPKSSAPVAGWLFVVGIILFSGSLYLGSWVPDVMAHGGEREPVLPATEAEREQWGREGQSQIIAIVRQMHLREAMEDLKKHDEFTNQVLVPKYGKILPGSH